MYLRAGKAGLLAAAVGSCAPAIAAEDHGHSPLPGTFSANITVTSDYIVRGISMTNEGPAIQGGLDWENGTGLYIGTWGSNVEFGNDASSEIDVYAGYRGAIGAFRYELGATYYWYPATTVSGLSFWDTHLDVGYDFGPAALNFGVAYSPDNFGPTVNDAALYYSVDLAIPVAEMVSLSGGIGYSKLESAVNYKDWNAGATFRVYDWFSADARYYDSDNAAVCGTICDARFVFKISKVF